MLGIGLGLTAIRRVAAPAPSCAVTLTGDVVSGFGLTPYETINVSAQSVATSSTAQRAATNEETVVDWAAGEKRLFEIVIDSDAGTTDGNVGISDLAVGNNTRFFWSQWTVGDVLGFALAGDGTSELFKNGVSQGAGATFPGNVYILLTTTGAAFSATVITNGADMQATYADSSIKDWCGGAI